MKAFILFSGLFSKGTSEISSRIWCSSSIPYQKFGIFILSDQEFELQRNSATES